jgi:hypothetical protein
VPTPFDARVRLEFEDAELARLRDRQPPGVTRDDVAAMIKAAIDALPQGPGGGGMPQTPWRSPIDGGGHYLFGDRSPAWKVNRNRLQDPAGAYTPLARDNTLPVDDTWTGRTVECWGPFVARIDLGTDMKTGWSLVIEGDPGNLGLELTWSGRGYVNDLPGKAVMLPGARRYRLRCRSNDLGDNPAVTLLSEPLLNDVFLRVITLRVPAGPVAGADRHVGRMVNVIGGGEVDYRLPAGAEQGSQIAVRRGGEGIVTISPQPPDLIDWPTGLRIERPRGILAFFRLDDDRSWGLWA